jgi:OmpA-OmpF porin, OOP family
MDINNALTFSILFDGRFICFLLKTRVQCIHVRGDMKKIFFFLSVGLLVLVANIGYADDVKGARDYPEIGRFQGSDIVAYEKKNFDEMTYVISKMQRGEETKTLNIEGEVTRIMYATPIESSVAEIFRNYKIALSSQGFETIFTCKSPDCGFNFPNKFMINRSGLYELSFGNAREAHRYLVARKVQGAAGDLYVAIMVYRNSSYTGDIRTQVEVVLQENLDDGKIVVKTAEDIGNSIKQNGHIALEGIYFDTGKSVLKPESVTAIAEIAKLLKASEEMKLFIVGHTDNDGSINFNMDLSSLRANAVRDQLVKFYDIDTNRLGTVGLGFFAPVASNLEKTGQAKNRRVELVEWNE